jgi:hypothetical protein
LTVDPGPEAHRPACTLVPREPERLRKGEKEGPPHTLRKKDPSSNALSKAFETLLKRYITPRAFSYMAGTFYRATLAMMDMLLGMLDVGGRKSRSHFYRIMRPALASGTHRTVRLLYDPEAIESLVEPLGTGYETPYGPDIPEDFLERIFAPEHFLDHFVPHKRRMGF